MTLFTALLARELRLALRHGADTLAAVLFFLLAGALFPLAIGPAPETLGRLAPGIVWVCALLAALLPLDRLFGSELEDGSLDQLLLCGLSPALLAGGKALGHWLVTGLPLLLAAGPLAVMLRMPPATVPVLLLSLLPGTMLLSLLGTTGAAVVLGRRRRTGWTPRRTCCCCARCWRRRCRCARSRPGRRCAGERDEAGGDAPSPAGR